MAVSKCSMRRVGCRGFGEGSQPWWCRVWKPMTMVARHAEKEKRGERKGGGAAVSRGGGGVSSANGEYGKGHWR